MNKNVKELKMSIDEFWKLIDETNAEVPYDIKKYYEKDDENEYYNKYLECLKNKLKNYSFTDIIEFYNIYTEYKTYLYRTDVWTECARVLQHCTDDGFWYFLDWIMSRGKKFYFDVCNNIRTIENLEWQIGTRNFEELNYISFFTLEEKWPEVCEVVGDAISYIDCLSDYDKDKIEEEVSEAFKNGVNLDDCSVEDNDPQNMWNDDELCELWNKKGELIKEEKIRLGIE